MSYTEARWAHGDDDSILGVCDAESIWPQHEVVILLTDWFDKSCPGAKDLWRTWSGPYSCDEQNSGVVVGDFTHWYYVPDKLGFYCEAQITIDCWNEDLKTDHSHSLGDQEIWIERLVETGGIGRIDTTPKLEFGG